ncbi:MAG: hypothetical protein ACUVXD_17765 [Thermodesulfobacteriota bacterium]
MKYKLDRVGIFFENMSEPQLISIQLPDDFHKMELNDRILFLANEIKALESKFPVYKDSLRRHTSLVRMEQGQAVYSVEYLPILDDEY